MNNRGARVENETQPVEPVESEANTPVEPAEEPENGCGCGCGCACKVDCDGCDDDVSPPTKGRISCLPISKWKFTPGKLTCCSCVCTETVEEPVEPAVENEVPEEDVEDPLSEDVLSLRTGNPFKNGKAVLIGINYTGTDSQLNGCINDVYNMYTYLTQVQKYDPTLIRILVDDENAQLHTLPTKKNILNAIHWLVHDNPMGDKENPVSLFLHYSGHGSWEWDRDGDESDRKDETICPLDYNENGLILDDQLRPAILNPIKDASNIHLTCVFDCCHSGTILDMRYNVRVRLNKNRPEYSRIAIAEDKHYAKSKCRVTVFSGCMDKQYSADAWINNQPQGALSWAFLYIVRQFIKNKAKLTYKKFIVSLQTLLDKKGYDQIPQLTFNKYVNLKERFSI